jgi:deoxycytidine triphosphate deaminase
MSAPVSVLSDATILELVQSGRIRLDPWDPSLVQPASVDLRLGDSFRVFHNHRASAIDLRDPPSGLTEEVVIGAEESFVIHPGEFCLGRTLEWVELPDDIVARIEGKALAVDTPVPTPDGWTTMGEVSSGDWVFDAHGHPTPVVATSETMVGRPCRRVEFSDGTAIVADVDHQWQVWTRSDRSRRGPRIHTTGEIERTLMCGREYNHWVAQTYSAGVVGKARDPATGQYVANESLHSRLRALDLLGNKHIPRDYLEPSVEQRRALLEGIMDTRYEVQFTPHDYVFRLPHKLPRQKLTQRFHTRRAITAVRPCDSVPVRCIEIGDPDGVFLVSRSFIPTHNSSIGRLGLIVHATAGFCDPGWKGTLTLELNNLTRIPIKLYPGLQIAQLSFMALDRPALRPYGSPELGSHYQGQRAATESRYRQPAGDANPARIE